MSPTRLPDKQRLLGRLVPTVALPSEMAVRDKVEVRKAVEHHASHVHLTPFLLKFATHSPDDRGRVPRIKAIKHCFIAVQNQSKLKVQRIMGSTISHAQPDGLLQPATIHDRILS